MAKEHVHGVFQSVASQYDAANTRISLGLHKTWKRALVDAVVPAARTAPGSRTGIVLDVCCGTGDIAELVARENPDLLVVGIDFSAEMLKVARERVAGLDNVVLVEGDAMDLPFADGTFDAAVVSFGLRNTPDYDRVVGEMARVVRTGGTVACLDASVPESPLVRPFYELYYKYVMTFLGGGFRYRDEYEWLYQSTEEFLRKDELVELFARCGMRDIRLRSFMFGSAALHAGTVLDATREA